MTTRFDDSGAQFADGSVQTKAANGRQLAQIQTFQTGAVSSGTTILPFDDTIPQITEGDQYMSLPFTPVNAASTLEIDVFVFGSHSAIGYLVAALFQDAIANALSVGSFYAANAGGLYGISFKVVVSAASTAARTYRVRAGASVAGTFTFNGNGLARYYGGALPSSITIKEFLP